ncbi:DUF2498 family protein [Celerinatantimonas yamalensis]|uniref:DUF2498 family protein n=1 Tax=Celerinatantimonas yamalensis TaxID=559956 RepID=A0ABW9G5I3_9GAMM
MEKQLISMQELVKLANEALHSNDDYIHGVEVHEAVQTPDCIVFKGENFLDEQGLPTGKSMAAFNLYKWLSYQFSDLYTVQP